MAEVTATLYRALTCRYFDENADKSFGSFAEVVVDLMGWIVRQNTVGETCTYEPLEGDTFLRTFCLDVRQLAVLNAVLVVTWNEVSGTDEGVQVVAANSIIGAANVSTTEIDALSVPGYPSFFVLIPGDETILNLRFSANRLNGSQPFQRYVLGFMQEGARWVVRKNDVFVGYSPDGSRAKKGYLPEFRTGLARRKTNLDWLRTNVGDVRKIVHRKLIKPVLEEHRDFLDRTFIMLGLKPNRRLKADIEFEYDFKIRLTEDKLEQIVEEFENRGAEDGWTDVGLIMARDSQKKHWLSGAMCREKLELPVRNASADMADIDSLVEVLNGRLEEIVRRVQ
jgi:hypothetical protein